MDYLSERLGQRRLNQLEEVDAMSPGLRSCVHEYGFGIVTCLKNYGITKPEHIHAVVQMIWAGAREAGGSQRQGIGRPAYLKHLDWILIQSGSSASSLTVARILHQNNFVIVPVSPTVAMIDASLDAVNHMGVVSKREKHRGRLAAALRAEAAKVVP